MKNITYGIIGVLVLAGLAFLIFSPGKPGKYDDFAKCIKDKGVQFYGAFWCPHCQAQKARFGKSAEYLPYIECSTPDGQGQTQVCKDHGITTYPTWFFPSGASSTPERVTGEQELTDLAQKTSCALPQ